MNIAAQKLLWSFSSHHKIFLIKWIVPSCHRNVELMLKFRLFWRTTILNVYNSMKTGQTPSAEEELKANRS